MKDLIESYLRAKGAEDAAKAQRVELARQIAEKLEHPDEGSKTHTVADYKVTVGQKINRKVNWALFDELYLEHPPVKTKREIDVKGLAWFAENDPDMHRRLCECITATPGRPQITVKEK